MAHVDTQTAGGQPAPTAKTSSAGAHGVTFGGVLKSEFIKFFSLMSTWILLAVSMVLIIGFDALQAFGLGTLAKNAQQIAAQTGQPTPKVDDNTLMSVPTAGLQMGMLILGALAVLMISSEYGTNMIRSSFAAVPRRWPVYLGKTVVIGIVGFVAAEIAMWIGTGVGSLILSAYDVKLDVGADGFIPSMLMGGVMIIGVNWMGLGLAALIRNSAGTIVTLVGLLFVLPIVGAILSGIDVDFFKYLPDYFPANAGSRMLEQSSGSGMGGDSGTSGVMEPWVAGLVFAAWVAICFIPGWVLFKRRDA